ncbi:MAG: hypothetical protein ACOCRX_01520 [Candidatus Woesearchaeota archaeon]
MLPKIDLLTAINALSNKNYNLKNFPDDILEEDWRLISSNFILTDRFIREYHNYVNWEYASAFQKLSEAIIREFKDKVDWEWICITQQLSENFIEEHINRIYWNKILIYQNLSKRFFNRHKHKIFETINTHSRELQGLLDEKLKCIE